LLPSLSLPPPILPQVVTHDLCFPPSSLWPLSGHGGRPKTIIWGDTPSNSHSYNINIILNVLLNQCYTVHDIVKSYPEDLYSSLILRHCSDSTALHKAYAKAIPHSEEGTFQKYNRLVNSIATFRPVT